MKVWITGSLPEKGFVLWRWTASDGLQGAATTRGLQVPSSVYEAGPEAVNAALWALLVYVDRQILQPKGWRVRREFIKHKTTQELMAEAIGSALIEVIALQTERERHRQLEEA